MKRGIEVWADYDRENRWCLKIKKAKGKFSLDEITDIAREYEEDFTQWLLTQCQKKLQNTMMLTIVVIS